MRTLRKILITSALCGVFAALCAPLFDSWLMFRGGIAVGVVCLLGMILMDVWGNL